MTTTKMQVVPVAVGSAPWLVPFLPLGMISAYTRKYNGGVLTSVMDIARPVIGGFQGLEFGGMKDIWTGYTVPEEPALYLLSSYVWNAELNIAAARRIKQASPESLVIIGGPQIPKREGPCTEFMRSHSDIDICVRGEGEQTMCDLLLALGEGVGRPFQVESLAHVAGVTYRRADGTLCRTAERERVKELDVIPSPYLEREFEPWFKEMIFACLETNRGCPYGCTYCDWGSATLQKIHKFDQERVEQEIDYMAERQVRGIYITDANFGIFERDVEIARRLVECKKKYGYPVKYFANYAKNGGKYLMDLLKVLKDGDMLHTGIVAIQSTEPSALKVIKRDNIKTEAYERLMEFCASENVTMASDLMLGLPGQTVDGFVNDLQFCFDWKVSATAFVVSMMPNAPMAEEGYMKRYKIVVGADGHVESTYSYTKEQLVYMCKLFLAYYFFVRVGVMKYFLYGLQIERSIRALDVIKRWLDRVLENDARIPLSLRTFNELLRTDHADMMSLRWGDESAFLFQNLPEFYGEVRALIEREFETDLTGSDVDSLLQAQAAVMPQLHRVYPFEVSLDRDVSGYFRQIHRSPNVERLRGKDEFTPLAGFGPGEMRVSGFEGKMTSLSFGSIGAHGDNMWELASPLRFY